MLSGRSMMHLRGCKASAIAGAIIAIAGAIIAIAGVTSHAVRPAIPPWGAVEAPPRAPEAPPAPAE